MLLDINNHFKIGEQVMVEQDGRAVSATVAAIIVEIGAEINVYYKLTCQETVLDYPLVIEEYLLNKKF